MSARTETKQGGAAVSKGTVVSVNVGTPREITLGKKVRTTSIYKSPVRGRARVEGINVAGDDQADKKVHGGPDKAVYAYALEDYLWWGAELGRSLDPGTFGDNLTISGLDITGALVGERWSAGSVLLEVVQPRMPCLKLGARMGDSRFPRRFSLANRPGAYLRILAAGDLGAGDEVSVVHRPAHHVSVGLIARIYYSERSRAHELLAAPELGEGWKEWVAGVG